MSRHRRKPFKWDIDGEWDGVVMMIDGVFVRHLDRNGQTRVPVADGKPK